MSTIQSLSYTLSAENERSEILEALPDTQRGTLSIDGTGELVITNTGGSSASEGGMGSGSDDDTEKGSLSKPGEKSGSASRNDEDEDLTFDPIKKNIKEA
ncbi:MAG TPA: hypothetical protein VF540_02435, partial [Segetibacter sp.]